MASPELRLSSRLTTWRSLQVLLAVALIIAAAVLLSRVGWHEFLDGTLLWLRMEGPWVFFAAMAVLPAVGFPLLPFTLTAGPAFGPTLGLATVILCSIAAVVINVGLSYAIAARCFLPLADRRGWRIPRPVARLTFPLLLLLRIAPGLPFWLQSYLLGLMRAPFVPYMVVSTLVPALYITGTVLGSTAILQGRKEMGLLVLVGVLIVGAVFCFVRRRHAAEIAALRASR